MRRYRPAALAAVGCLLALTTLASTAASADPLGDADAQARVLQAQVAHLQLQVEVASEKFDGAQAHLAELVTEQAQATRVATAARAAADSARAIADSSARALYMSGGTMGLYASVISGQDPTRLLDGLHSVQAVSDADTHALLTVASSEKTAEAADAEVAALRTRQDLLTAQAASATTTVENALAEQQQTLADTNAQVVTLEAQFAAQVEAQQEAQDAQTLALARQAAAAVGLIAGNPSRLALTVIAAAGKQLGKPYVFGGSGPDSWDCSGLTQWAFGQAGIVLPRTAADQYAAIPDKIALGTLEPGDLLFWATDTSDPTTIHHVAIYVGGGMMLAAPHTGANVQVQPVYLDGYIGAARVG
jgi:peptidoglycan DL-endopeptidase CwlO